MYKYLLIASFLFTGCSYFEFNAAMCEKIRSEPGDIVPQECRNYNEKEAQKAFDKTKVKPSTNVKEDLEFGNTK